MAFNMQAKSILEFTATAEAASDVRVYCQMSSLSRKLNSV